MGGEREMRYTLVDGEVYVCLEDYARHLERVGATVLATRRYNWCADWLRRGARRALDSLSMTKDP